MHRHPPATSARHTRTAVRLAAPTRRRPTSARHPAGVSRRAVTPDRSTAARPLRSCRALPDPFLAAPAGLEEFDLVVLDDLHTVPEGIAEVEPRPGQDLAEVDERAAVRALHAPYVERPAGEHDRTVDVVDLER